MQIEAQHTTSVKNDKNSIIYRLLKPSPPLNKVGPLPEDASIEVFELLESIKSARREWTNANENFEYVNEKEMVDYYTYKIKACEVRYEYLIRKAKEKRIRVELLKSTMG